MPIALDAHPSAAWSAPCRGHEGIRIRALAPVEVREAMREAAEVAPLDLYGQTVWGRIVEAHLKAMDGLREIAVGALVAADKAAGSNAAEAADLLDVGRRAHKALQDEVQFGRVRKESLLAEEDPHASRALARWRMHIVEPHRQIAARALVEWPGVLKAGFTLADALAALGPKPGDPLGLEGAAIAEQIVAHLDGRALGERGKGRFARRQSSRAATKTATRSSPAPSGIAATANGGR